MLVLYVLFFMLVGILAGCSSKINLSLENDSFWWKGAEPRENMNWFSSVGGNSNANKGFTKLGG